MYWPPEILTIAACCRAEAGARPGSEGAADGKTGGGVIGEAVCAPAPGLIEVKTTAAAALTMGMRTTDEGSLTMLFLTKDDFRIKAESFDLTKGANIVRIAAGAFMFPHVAGKFAAIGTLTLKAGTVGFFAKAGMTPPEFWVYLAAVAELTAGIFLVLGLCTRYAALGAAAVLGVAVYALQTVKGFSGWTWNNGGYEYPVFWAIVCLAIALEEFKAARSAEKHAMAPGGTPSLAT